MKKVELNEQLAKALELIGNTPMDEPEIFEAVDLKPPEKMKMNKMKVITIALERSNLNHKDFTALEMGAFFNAVNNKVSSFENEDGVLKSVPSLDKMRLPSFEEVEGIQNQLDSIQELNFKETDPEKITKATEQFIDANNELQKMVWDISGLDKDGLTEWEQTLVVQHIFRFITDVEKTSMGKL